MDPVCGLRTAYACGAAATAPLTGAYATTQQPVTWSLPPHLRQSCERRLRRIVAGVFLDPTRRISRIRFFGMVGRIMRQQDQELQSFRLSVLNPYFDCQSIAPAQRTTLSHTTCSRGMVYVQSLLFAPKVVRFAFCFSILFFISSSTPATNVT